MDLETQKKIRITFLIIAALPSARLAQSVERGTFNPEVKGSSPLSGENFAQVVMMPIFFLLAISTFIHKMASETFLKMNVGR